MTSSSSSSSSVTNSPIQTTINNRTLTILIIDNFSHSTNDYYNRYLSTSTNRFELRLYPKGPKSCFDNDVTIYLRLVYSSKVHLVVNYKVSILNELQNKLYSQEYQWNYSQDNVEHFAKFISRSILLNSSNNFIKNNKLSILCEVSAFESDAKPVLDQIETSETNLEQMSSDFESLLRSEELSDVALKIGDKSYKCHKLILSARSPVFGAMLQHCENKEVIDSEVIIIDIEFDVFEQLLKYIYTGKIDSLDRLAPELLTAADKYQINCLKAICEQYLCSTLTIDFVANTLLLADMHKAAKLKSKCIDYITSLDNTTDVMQSEGWTKIATQPELLLELFASLVDKQKKLNN